MFVCVQNRPLGDPRGSCQARGGPLVFERFVDEFTRRGLWSEHRLTNAGCLGPCEGGANVVVYPDGLLYHRVTAADVSEIVQGHLIGGNRVERLAHERW